MSRFTNITNIRLALSNLRHPTAVSWNRLEGRPRTNNFPQALRAEVRDPLWMLARQWQMGEFEGDDAASPVFAKAHVTTTKIRKYQPAKHSVQPFDDSTPLEAQVECRPVPMKIGGQPIGLDIRLMMGRYWFKLLNDVTLQTEFLTQYPIELPNPDQPEGAPIFAHQEVWQQWSAAAGRRMDGFSLYEYLQNEGSNKASDDIPSAGPAIDSLGELFVNWLQSFFLQPKEEKDAWEPGRLEYQFNLAAPADGIEKILSAEEYYHGHLDWYNLDHDKTPSTLGEELIPSDPDTESSHTHTFIPTQVTFDGMPNTRWWAFEEGKTNFGDIRPNRDDLGKLLVMEFALVYANDWFIFPFPIEAGSLSLVQGLAVTNVFGERTWVEAGSKGLDDDFSRWSLFTLNTKGKRAKPADLTLVILPTVSKIQQGKPLEEIAMIRDEMANMVWGIESRIPSPSGGSMDGRTAASETRKYFEKLAGVEPVDLPKFKSKIRYEVMNNLPENWIPFLPAQIEGSQQQVHLQRASMLRFFIGDADRPKKIKPRSNLLRAGLDDKPVSSYFIAEEEVNRSGIQVSQAFQRTRWYHGKVFNWVGTCKKTGRGEGSSDLAFDSVLPTKQKKSTDS